MKTILVRTVKNGRSVFKWKTLFDTESVHCRAVFGVAFVLTISSVQADNKVVPTHCKSEERVVLSCPFKHGKTVSLCASTDLTKTTGTLQYRYGMVGKKPELMFPTLGERENPIYDHPTWNFHLYANAPWSTANIPLGESVNIHMTFTPLDDHPEINFVIDAEAGPESRYQGTMLTIYESGGQGRTIAEYRCIKEKTTEDLFSLKDIIQK